MMIRLIVISYHLSFTDYNRLLLQNYLKLRFVQYYDNIILPLAIAHLYGTYQNLIGSNRKYNTLNRLAEQCYVAKVIERAETKLMMYIQQLFIRSIGVIFKEYLTENNGAIQQCQECKKQCDELYGYNRYMLVFIADTKRVGRFSIKQGFKCVRSRFLSSANQIKYVCLMIIRLMPIIGDYRIGCYCQERHRRRLHSLQQTAAWPPSLTNRVPAFFSAIKPGNQSNPNMGWIFVFLWEPPFVALQTVGGSRWKGNSTNQYY